LILTAGQVHEVTQAVRLIEDLPLVSVIADKAYDTDAFRTCLIEA
jgi:transposase